MASLASVQDVILQVVEGLGYDLIEVEWLPAGLLRVTIDFPFANVQEDSERVLSDLDTAHPLIGIDDCERVTRQLQYVLEVEQVAYQRLEVASPGIDRPLRHRLDFCRFAGELVDITLKEPMDTVVNGVSVGQRRRFRGVLEAVEAEHKIGNGGDLEVEQGLHRDRGGDARRLKSNEDGGLWRVVWSDAPPPKPGVRVSAKRKEQVYQALTFSLDEIKEARLAPVVSFKGRRNRAA